ncbi:hypothetical protein Nepgr_015633 [Nepenthes gracilis]|uniref:RING-type E3 ubiquitin transferase n=1 Tax=Nepenthes gracilis TaxID=150966 RepID=A0AAD3SMG1_NEPGR|nr:hypothetical protein Nepgr_015633 [Nepenthes gracilis]
MEWVLLEIKEKSSFPPLKPPPFLSQPPPPLNLQSDTFGIDDKIRPSIVLIIIILAIIFFVSGLAHLLIRFLLRPIPRELDDLEDVTAFQGRLQQLFHLHDAGVDQTFIDALPVFLYKAIIGLKDPFDCAVCLCEFGAEDKLRLLPKCSHAFHMECIDTWLLSHSTCPLCRASLLPDFSPNNDFSPIVFVLESGSDSSREIAIADREAALGRTNSMFRSSSQLGIQRETESGSTRIEISRKSSEQWGKNDAAALSEVPNSGAKIVPVRLGKFRNLDGGEGSSENNVGSRRCYSMGSFAYVLDETSSLQVPIRTPVKKQSTKESSLPLKPSYRTAISEYGSDSRRIFTGVDAFRSVEIHETSSSTKGEGNAIERSKRESFSISKIWLQGEKKEKATPNAESTKRASSFRFPLGKNGFDGFGGSGGGGSGRACGASRTTSEIIVDGMENDAGEWEFDEESQSCNSMDSQAAPPSSTRRTLLWLMGKQNKVVHSSSSDV